MANECNEVMGDRQNALFLDSLFMHHYFCLSLFISLIRSKVAAESLLPHIAGDECSYSVLMIDDIRRERISVFLVQ